MIDKIFLFFFLSDVSCRGRLFSPGNTPLQPRGRGGGHRERVSKKTKQNCFRTESLPATTAPTLARPSSIKPMLINTAARPATATAVYWQLVLVYCTYRAAHHEHRMNAYKLLVKLVVWWSIRRCPTSLSYKLQEDKFTVKSHTRTSKMVWKRVLYLEVQGSLNVWLSTTSNKFPTLNSSFALSTCRTETKKKIERITNKQKKWNQQAPGTLRQGKTRSTPSHETSSSRVPCIYIYIFFNHKN